MARFPCQDFIKLEETDKAIFGKYSLYHADRVRSAVILVQLSQQHL